MYASGARSYRNVGLEARVSGSDPHGLVLMLFDGAIERIGLARNAIEGGDRRRKIDALASASNIVDGLRQSLDRSVGGELPQRLDALYDYVGRRLLHANAHDDTAALVEAAELLGELRAAWAGMQLPADA